ncbi:hypothetical protein D9758_003403 [Tetrapyrgos nigripes]|uniref:DH domain-containing protein n=1 Tax=Tetrapyrgos nigripes TaxID=182062 RepID=A0A8H5GVC8_9AGAR|nr:hypothetical protein D9758_003403 [Tetrapyrgos nigripes]
MSMVWDDANARRGLIVRELVETERKYVQDLELLQRYASAVFQSNIIGQDVFGILFPNIDKLVNFQHNCLFKFESIAELPWVEQRWGQAFLEREEEFLEIYGPLCANYQSASDLVIDHAQSLAALNHIIIARSELPGFIIKPISRICKYPLLLDCLLKACNLDDYPYYEELKAGSDAHKRVTDKVNEIQRQTENEQTIKDLVSRVEDWKGHQVEDFGRLLLDDVFVVTKSDIDREYNVFLFEKMFLCCKEARNPDDAINKRAGRVRSSVLKKQSMQTKKKCPLLLKGRIFLRNVFRVESQNPHTNSSASSASNQYSQYPLSVWWKGDNGEEFLTL